jgi:phytoene desaturase
MVDTGAVAQNPPELGEEFDAVIVGAGIGGLTCGALLAKHGAKVLIVERHNRPGGFVTSFDRKGYGFQVPHLMGGCGPGGEITRIIDHLGIRVDFLKLEPLMRFMYPDHDITVPTDRDQYADILKDAFQPQTANINSYFKALKTIGKGMDHRMARRPMPFGDMMKMLAYPFTAPTTLSYMLSGTTFSKMLDKHFSDDRLKAVLATPWPFLGNPPWEVSALMMIGMLNSFEGGAYIPVGGFQVLADAFAKSFTDNGGTLLLGYEATAINTERGRVCGIETNPRAKVASQIVISDADSKRTFIKLMDRENFSQSFLEKVDDGPVSMSGVVVHLGLAKTLGDEFAGGPVMFQPSYDEREMLEEISVKDRYPDPAKIRWSILAPSMTDPTIAPQGKTSMDILVPNVPYRFMSRWGVEPGGIRGDKYNQIKEKYAEVVVEAVSRVFPGLVTDVESFEVATPITYERYTMAIDGCWYDSAPIPKQSLGKRPGPKTSVRGLMITGSKTVYGGGIYPSIMGGLLTADSATRGEIGNLFS